MATNFIDQLGIDEVSPGQFESKYPAGGRIERAYGGCTIAFVVSSAYKTVSSKYILYSVVGNFLGPAMSDRKYLSSVRDVRQTGTFATRQVEVSQVMDNGKNRMVMIAIADFQTQEPESVLEYSAPPTMRWPPPMDCPSLDETRHIVVRNNGLSKDVAETHKTMFSLHDRYFDQRLPPHSVMAQNLLGVLNVAKTSQDELPMIERASADWLKTKERMTSSSQNVAATAFILDELLAFCSLAHSNQSMFDAQVTGSLEFAFRVFSNTLQLDQWHLREIKPASGGSGRTYAEARLWDESGKMVANMTQQGIMRPHPDKEPVSKPASKASI